MPLPVYWGGVYEGTPSKTKGYRPCDTAGPGGIACLDVVDKSLHLVELIGELHQAFLQGLELLVKTA